MYAAPTGTPSRSEAGNIGVPGILTARRVRVFGLALHWHGRRAIPGAMKRISLTTIGCFMAFTLASTAARAQRSPDAGIEVAVRTGLALPFGERLNGSNLDNYASSAVPIILEGGYRLDSSLFFGLRLQYGFPQLKNPNGGCGGNISCDGSVVMLGLEGAYRFQPEATFAPWLGAGVGYEWASADFTGPNVGGGATDKGFQALLQAGGDVRVTPKLVLGPFLEAAFGRYDSADTRVRVFNTIMETSSDITNTAWHTWITLGVRGAFDI
jgi:hypothetical protein